MIINFCEIMLQLSSCAVVNLFIIVVISGQKLPCYFVGMSSPPPSITNHYKIELKLPSEKAIKRTQITDLNTLITDFLLSRLNELEYFFFGARSITVCLTPLWL